MIYHLLLNVERSPGKCQSPALFDKCRRKYWASMSLSTDMPFIDGSLLASAETNVITALNRYAWCTLWPMIFDDNFQISYIDTKVCSAAVTLWAIRRASGQMIIVTSMEKRYRSQGWRHVGRDLAVDFSRACASLVYKRSSAADIMRRRFFHSKLSTGLNGFIARNNFDFTIGTL